MKKISLLLLSVLISFSALAQLPTNQYFSKEKSNFLTFEFPKKTSYNLTIYNNPINHEVFIINIEKKQ